MIESIVDKDLHNKLLNAVGREKMKKTFKSNLRPFSCWYLCAGNDFMAIKTVLELNRANDLEDPYFFIFTDNNYFCSEDGKPLCGVFQLWKINRRILTKILILYNQSIFFRI